MDELLGKAGSIIGEINADILGAIPGKQQPLTTATTTNIEKYLPAMFSGEISTADGYKVFRDSRNIEVASQNLVFGESINYHSAFPSRHSKILRDPLPRQKF